jgi:hypothetical protein
MREPKKECPNCGAFDWIADIRVIDRVKESQQESLTLEIDTNPNALIFRGPRQFPLSAQVCTQCGFTQLFVDDLQGLILAQEAFEHNEQIIDEVSDRDKDYFIGGPNDPNRSDNNEKM